MAQQVIRSYSDSNRNKTVTVTYEDLPDRRIIVETTPIDPGANMLGGGMPTDGIPSGASLGVLCEGLTLVEFTATNVTPYATFTATDNSPSCPLGGGPGGGGTPLPAGTFLRYECRNAQGQTGQPDSFDNYRVTADGQGGETSTLFEGNSASCGYVPPVVPQLTVAQLPGQWAPVHLPVLLTLTAQPATGNVARDVVAFLDTSTDNGTTWQEAGRMRRTAGSNKLVQFNLSEYLKAHFTISPPVTGPDAALSLRYRVRLGFAPTYVGEVEGEELRVEEPLYVVNGAAPNGGSGAYLSDLIPLPEGYAYRLSKIGTSSVSNLITLPATDPAACPPYPVRLLWLNARGGWNSYVFGGKHEYGTTVEGSTVWRDAAGADRYADRGTVRPTLAVYSDRLTPEMAALVRTVRHSVQVYLLPETGPAVPVLLAEGSYRDYREADKTHTVDFSLTLPRLAVQTQ